MASHRVSRPILEKLRPSQIQRICEAYRVDPAATVTAIAVRAGLTRWIAVRAINALRAAGRIGDRVTLRDRAAGIAPAPPDQPRCTGLLPAYDRSHSCRARVIDLVCAAPGVQLGEISARLGLAPGSVKEALRFLRGEGLLLPYDPDRPGAWPTGGER